MVVLHLVDQRQPSNATNAEQFVFESIIPHLLKDNYDMLYVSRNEAVFQGDSHGVLGLSDSAVDNMLRYDSAS
jgi:hypothetical protein